MKINYLEFIGRKLRPVEFRLIVKWILNLKRKKIFLPDNRVYEIDPISDFGLRLAKDHNYEPEMTSTIESLLKEGDTFIDLGANEGYFTVLGAKLVASAGKVFSIEPQKRLWDVIENNIMLNDLYNVQLLPNGIGAENKELILQLYPSTNSGASGFSNSFNFNIAFSSLRKKIYGSQLARVITLDSLTEILPENIRLIKIDIEGYELEALKGAKALLSKKRLKHLLIEIHHRALAELKQNENMIDEVLSEYGYSKSKISFNLNLYSLI